MYTFEQVLEIVRVRMDCANIADGHRFVRNWSEHIIAYCECPAGWLCDLTLSRMFVEAEDILRRFAEDQGYEVVRWYESKLIGMLSISMEEGGISPTDALGLASSRWYDDQSEFWEFYGKVLSIEEGFTEMSTFIPALKKIEGPARKGMEYIYSIDCYNDHQVVFEA